MAKFLKLSLEITDTAIAKKFRESVKLYIRKLTNNIGTKVGFKIGELLLEDAKQQVRSQGTFYGSRYARLRPQYALRKLYLIAKDRGNEIPKIPNMAFLANILSEKEFKRRFQEEQDKVDRKIKAITDLIAVGGYRGIKILELQKPGLPTSLAGYLSRIKPIVSSSDNVLNLKIPTKYVKYPAHQKGYTTGFPGKARVDVSQRRIFRTGITKEIQALVKQGCKGVKI